MRYAAAIVATLVLATPVVAQEALTLEHHEIELLPENLRAQRYSKVARLSLTVRNQTDRPITAWRVQAVFTDPFGDKMFSIQLTSGTGTIAPGDTDEATFAFEDNQFIDGEPYDQLAAYTSENVSISFSNIRVVH